MASIQLRLDELQLELRSRLQRDTDDLEALIRQHQSQIESAVTTATDAVGGAVKRAAWKWALLLGGALGLGGTGGLAYLQQSPKDQVVEVQETVESQGRTIDHRADEQGKRFERLEGAVLKIADAVDRIERRSDESAEREETAEDPPVTPRRRWRRKPARE